METSVLATASLKIVVVFPDVITAQHKTHILQPNDNATNKCLEESMCAACDTILKRALGFW